MTEISIDWRLRNWVDKRLGLPIVSPESILGHYPPPGPPVLFEDLEDNQGVPLLSPLLRDREWGNWFKIAQLETRNAEVAIPQAIQDGSATNIVVSVAPNEFASRFGFEPDSTWVHKMRRFWHLDGILAGGVDEGMLPARYLEALAIQDEAAQRGVALDERLLFGAFRLPPEFSLVRGELAEISRHLQERNISELQRMYRQHPVIFLTYLVRVLASFWDEKDLVQNLPRLRQQSEILRTVTGVSLDEPSTEAYTPVFNNALTLYSDRLFAEAYPATFALANQASAARLPVDYYMRFSHPYLWLLYQRYVVDSGLVNKEVFAASGARAYGNVRGTYALGLEAAQKRGFRSQLERVLGKKIPAGQEGNQKIFQAMVELAALAHEGTTPVLLRREIETLRIAYVNLIRRQYDLIRCRLDIEAPDVFNRAVRRAKAIVESSSGLRRLLVSVVHGFPPEIYARTSKYSYRNGPDREKIPLLPSTDPFRLFAEVVLSLTEDQLAYASVHYHGPLGQNLVKRTNGISSHGFWGEVQITPSVLRPMNSALQPIFAQSDRRLSREMRESYTALLRDTKKRIAGLL